MEKSFSYSCNIVWEGNLGTGTSAYDAYGRNHIIHMDGKPPIAASSDAPFRGDVTRINPEDMLLSALASCHMLWYLHLCADAGVVVTHYICDAHGTLVLPQGAAGHFSQVTLLPDVTVASSDMIAKANELHEEANKKCFMANSVNFPVHHQPNCHI
jgi:organic hydroperoxide reductase OsmC/OhrA